MIVDRLEERRFEAVLFVESPPVLAPAADVVYAGTNLRNRPQLPLLSAIMAFLDANCRSGNLC
jgi:hypothetical protein